jgi:3-hydroxyacyl-CoA dehydrogenase/3-hydroxy-2-methylbutyryl-CoA dehydrogenase
MRVDGSVGVVTGGASGLGEAAARMLVEGGGRVAIFDRQDSDGEAVAHGLGDAALFVGVDVSRDDEVDGAMTLVGQHFGRLDVTVNCAGVSPRHAVVDESGTLHPLGLFRRAVDVNLVGLFDVVRHSAQLMAQNAPGADGERGLIVNVASIAGIEGQAGQTAYAATKGAVLALTLPLARDLAGVGIRVMAIAPGMMDTAMLRRLEASDRDALVAHHLFPKRLGRPGEFAELVRALMEITLFNGEVVRLDAGTRLGPQ